MVFSGGFLASVVVEAGWLRARALHLNCWSFHLDPCPLGYRHCFSGEVALTFLSAEFRTLKQLPKLILLLERLIDVAKSACPNHSPPFSFQVRPSTCLPHFRRWHHPPSEISYTPSCPQPLAQCYNLRGHLNIWWMNQYILYYKYYIVICNLGQLFPPFLLWLLVSSSFLCI